MTRIGLTKLPLKERSNVVRPMCGGPCTLLSLCA